MLMLCFTLIVIEFVSWIPQVTTSIQSPPFSFGPTPSQSLTSLVQTLSTPIGAHSFPALPQSIHLPFHFPYSKTTVFRRGPLDNPNHLRKILLKLRFIRRVFLAADDGRWGNFGVEAVVVVTEEAAVEENAGGDGGEAAWDLGAAGGVAEEAVGVRQVVEALGQAVHGRRGINKVGAPLVFVDELWEALHFFHEIGDEVYVWRRFESSTVEAGFGGSGITERNREKQEEEEEEPCQSFGMHHASLRFVEIAKIAEEHAVAIIYIDMGSDFVAFFWIQVCVFAFMMSLLALVVVVSGSVHES